MSKVACSDFSRTIPSVRLPIDRIRLSGILLLAITAFAVQSAVGQGADSSLVSLATDSTRSLPAIEVDSYVEGHRSDTTHLVGIYAHDVVEFLGDLPGSFRYSMGNLGWPDQWSHQGSSPVGVALTLDGITLQDPVTSRPLFEVLPTDLLVSPSLFSARHSATVGVGFTTRRFDVSEPLTELRYRSGQPGLQSISATHVQQRHSQVLGSPTVLQVLFRYGAGEWAGAYPNSFSDASQVYGRVGLIAPDWALRVTNLHTRRHGGAHSGVLSNTSVRNPDATFRIKRNDLRVAIDRRLLPGVRPLSVAFSWASHVRRYRDVSTIEAQVHEYTFAVAQEIPAILPQQRIVSRLTTRFDGVRSSTILGDSTNLTRKYVEGVLETEIASGKSELSGHLGFVQTNGYSLPQLRVAVGTLVYGFDLSSEISLTGRSPSRLEEFGSRNIAPLENGELDAERSQRTSVSIQRPLGSSRMGLEAFALSRRSPIEVWQVAADSFRVEQSADGITWAGLTGTFGWRDASTRGFYGELQSTIQASSASGDDAFLAAIDESLPAFHGRLRLGAKYALFEGDLDLDVYVIGRYWSLFHSRSFDPITGILGLAAEGSGEIGNSGTLDLRVEAGIRSATAFVGIENALASLSYPGTLLVPLYPLASRAFRFGVLWPINN